MTTTDSIAKLDLNTIVPSILRRHPAGIQACRIAACIIDHLAQGKSCQGINPLLAGITSAVRAWCLDHQHIAHVDHRGRWHLDPNHRLKPTTTGPGGADTIDGPSVLHLYSCGASIERLASLTRTTVADLTAWLRRNGASRNPALGGICANAIL